MGDGLISEWYAEAAREVTDPATGLLERQASGVYTIRSLGVGVTRLTRRLTELYTILGRFLALSIVHGRPVGIRLSAAVYAHILDQDPTLDDMAIDEPELVRSLRLMLEAPEGELENFPLEINGVEVEVTLENRRALVGRKLRSMMPPRTDVALGVIVSGFRTVLDRREFSGVTVGQLGDVLYGNPVIDVEDLISSIELGGTHSVTDDHIQWLLETLRSTNNQQRRDFVRFAFGSPIAPVGGFRTLNRKIRILDAHDVRAFPTSKTCFHWIYLPRYTTKALLQEKLAESLANNGAMQD